MEESRGAKAANDSHFLARRRWRRRHRARRSGCVVFSRLLGWVSKIANGPTGHRRGQLDMSFSQERAYKTIPTLTLTKQVLSRLCQLKSRKAKLRNHLGFVGEIVILKRGLPSRSPPATFGIGIPSPDGSAPLLDGDAPAENAHRSDRTAPGSVGPAPPS